MFPPLIGHLLLAKKELSGVLLNGKCAVFYMLIVTEYLKGITTLIKICKYRCLFITYLCLLYHVSFHIKKKKLVYFSLFAAGIKKKHFIGGAGINFYFVFLADE